MENRPDETEKLRKEIKSELGRFLILSQRIERGTQSCVNPVFFNGRPAYIQLWRSDRA